MNETTEIVYPAITSFMTRPHGFGDSTSEIVQSCLQNTA